MGQQLCRLPAGSYRKQPSGSACSVKRSKYSYRRNFTAQQAEEKLGHRKAPYVNARLGFWGGRYNDTNWVVLHHPTCSTALGGCAPMLQHSTASPRLPGAFSNHQLRAQELDRLIDALVVYQAQKHRDASFTLPGEVMMNRSQWRLEKPRLRQIIVTDNRNSSRHPDPFSV